MGISVGNLKKKLIIEVGEPTQLGAVPPLENQTKVGEEGRLSKAMNSIPQGLCFSSASRFLLELLPWLSSVVDCGMEVSDK